MACEALRAGKVILYPTDTVWGIGCDASDNDAVERIYKLKRRSDSKAMLLLADSVATVKCHFGVVTPEAEELLADERPTTVILGSPRGVAPALIASDGTVGVRVTREPYSRTLCERAGMLIVSTSANISGEPGARNFSEISDEIKDGVDYVCLSRRGEKTMGIPSRIVKLNADNTITIIRN